MHLSSAPTTESVHFPLFPDNLVSRIKILIQRPDMHDPSRRRFLYQHENGHRVRTDRTVRSRAAPPVTLSSSTTCPQSPIYMLGMLRPFSSFQTAMDQQFQFAVQPPPPPLLDDGSAVNEAYINGVRAGLSFRSLLTYGGSFESAGETPNPLKISKTEPLSPAGFGEGYSTTALPYHFFSDTAAAAAASSSSSSLHLQLPSLLSLELPPNSTAAGVDTGKRRRRRQQETLSDKTRCLQKLLPWDEKMDMATVLEQAYKYIKFLQAQISVLQSMPCEIGGGGGSAEATSSVCTGDLGRLNRQQLLQVVVNSPVAQTHLYSKGCCLYSVEQFVRLKRNAERKQALYQQMLLDSSNPNPNPNLFF